MMLALSLLQLASTSHAENESGNDDEQGGALTDSLPVVRLHAAVRHSYRDRSFTLVTDSNGSRLLLIGDRPDSAKAAPAVPKLGESLGDLYSTDPEQRLDALYRLGDSGQFAHAGLVRPMVFDPNEEVALAALELLLQEPDLGTLRSVWPELDAKFRSEIYDLMVNAGDGTVPSFLDSAVNNPETIDGNSRAFSRCRQTCERGEQ